MTIYDTLKGSPSAPSTSITCPKKLSDKLVSLVERMLDLHKKKAALPSSAKREKIEREIAVTDEKIDEIIYALYEISLAKRKIIEAN